MKDTFKVEGTVTLEMDENLNDTMLELLDGKTEEERIDQRAELLATLMTFGIEKQLIEHKDLSGAQILFVALQEKKIQLQDIFYLATCMLNQEANQVSDRMMKKIKKGKGFSDKFGNDFHIGLDDFLSGKLGN